MSVVCTGRGDLDGSHCCFIDGKECEFLFTDRGGTPRCSLFKEWGSLAENPEWQASPVGRWFARTYPDFDCGDWPQRIPDVVGGVCCWTGKL